MSGLNEIRVLLEKKIELLIKISEVTAQQTALIDQTLTVELLDNIRIRQHLIDAVDEIDAHLPPRAELERIAGLEPYLGKIRSILQSVAAKDKENEELAIVRRGQLQDELKKTSAGVRAASAYNRPSHTQSAHFNQNH